MACGINGVHTDLKKDGRLRFEEYYPNALEDTYKGVKGYIYSCNQITPYQKLNIKIPNAFISAQKTAVDNCEFIPDAYNVRIFLILCK